MPLGRHWLLWLACTGASGGAAAAESVTWVVTPLSGAPVHHIADWQAWHGRWMVLAWGILLPLGALIARFFKVLPWQTWPERLDNRTWWIAHNALQWGGVLAMFAGLVLTWGHPAAATPVVKAHAALGYVLVVAGVVQVLSGLFRGSKGGPTSLEMTGDHYDMTRWRRGFERLHKALGWSALLLAVVTILLGLWAADAPRWMLLVLVAWWGLLGAAFARWQRQGRCMDTYQAIWGPDPSHPGNRRPPIGWGVRRYEPVPSQPIAQRRQ